jgi:hypothetical protein
MNRIAMIVVTCVLGLVLTACGENNAPKPAVGKTNAPTTTNQTPATQNH